MSPSMFSIAGPIRARIRVCLCFGVITTVPASAFAQNTPVLVDHSLSVGAGATLAVAAGDLVARLESEVVPDRLVEERGALRRTGNIAYRVAKLVLFDQRVEMDGRQPILQKGKADAVAIEPDEPLRRECEHFLECVRDRNAPLTDAESGIRVLKVLQACQVSLQLNGRPVSLSEIQ